MFLTAVNDNNYNDENIDDNNPYPKIIYLNFQPIEVVSRYCDPQPQLVENYSYSITIVVISRIMVNARTGDNSSIECTE